MSIRPPNAERDSMRAATLPVGAPGDEHERLFRDSGTFPRMVISNGVPIGIASRDDAHFIALWRNIMFAGFSGSVEGHMLQSMGSAVQHQLARYPEGVGLVVVAQPGCRPPSADLRDDMLALRRRTTDKTLGIAFVLRGEGFAASALRGAITGIQIVIRSDFPEKVFSETEPGLDWLFPHCGFDSPADQSEGHRALAELLRRA